MLPIGKNASQRCPLFQFGFALSCTFKGSYRPCEVSVRRLAGLGENAADDDPLSAYGHIGRHPLNGLLPISNKFVPQLPSTRTNLKLVFTFGILNPVGWLLRVGYTQIHKTELPPLEPRVMIASQVNVLKLIVAVAIISFLPSTALGQPTTFRYEAERIGGESVFNPLPEGHRASGTFTYDRSVSHTGFHSPDITDDFQVRYNDAVTDFTVDLGVFGAGHGSTGGVSVGASTKVRNLGDGPDFYVDRLSVDVEASGITLMADLYDSELAVAQFIFEDFDLEAIVSEELPAKLPDLGLFQQEASNASRADRAHLLLQFRVPTGGLSQTNFRLLSVTAVPEPGSSWLVMLAATALCSHRKRLGKY